MGIDFSHGGAQWSYSGFAQFRTALATREGITLRDMTGFGGDQPWSTVASPLRPLLDHSDCDGDLSPADCQAMAGHLRTVIDDLWPADLSWGDDPGGVHNRRAGLALADGMDEAAATGEPLRFC